MLTRSKHKEWTVLSSDADPAARRIFEKFIDGDTADMRVTSLKAGGRTGPVYEIEFDGKKYVLKHDLRQRHRFDYLVQSFFRGSNAFRLLRKLERALEKSPGERGVARVFLAADKRDPVIGRIVFQCFVLMEFVDGEEVGNIPGGIEKYAPEVARIVHWMHDNEMVHGDVHEGNFMVEKSTGTVRAMDVSGKKPSRGQKALDRIRLEKVFGIKDEEHDPAEFFVRLRLRLRKFFHRLRAKK